MSSANLLHQQIKTKPSDDLRKAACKNVEDPEIFMGSTPAARAEAAAYCGGCDARVACFAYAQKLKDGEQPVQGVWGGHFWPVKGLRWQIGAPVDLPEGVAHGMRKAWELHGCRCEPCGDALGRSSRRKEVDVA